MPFLPPNQQHQSTEGRVLKAKKQKVEENLGRTGHQEAHGKWWLIGDVGSFRV